MRYEGQTRSVCDTYEPYRQRAAGGALAVSSRGLGRGPLKAQTRVRIPLPLLEWLVWYWYYTTEIREAVRSASSRGLSQPRGPFVYRLGRHPFTVQRGVRFPYGLS